MAVPLTEHEVWTRERERVATRAAGPRYRFAPLRLLIVAAVLGAAIGWRLFHG